MRALGHPVSKKVSIIAATVMLNMGQLPWRAHAATIITFDAPGGNYTAPVAINRSGAIAGIVGDTNPPPCYPQKGFVRDPAGTITDFVPGSGAQDDVVTASVNGMNDAGEIAGSFLEVHREADNSCTFVATHGFVRSPAGIFTDFDPPSVPPGTIPNVGGINNTGAVVGYYIDGQVHGFMRDASGQWTVIDPPASTRTIACCINDKGTIAGYFDDNQTGATHGFIRDTQGNFTQFDIPGAVNLNVTGLSKKGGVTGAFYDGTTTHGYTRPSGGPVTIFDAPGAQSTSPYAIFGQTIAGYYFDGVTTRAFIRKRNGGFMTFNVPGADGTAALGITKKGTVTGQYYASGTSHGFVRTR
ncbi:MAG: hypothetical protein JO056_05365 [Alphaproteobacteria bacterium]|nr:hypothetical protein [Alphaproteobacteria bacterium]